MSAPFYLLLIDRLQHHFCSTLFRVLDFPSFLKKLPFPELHSDERFKESKSSNFYWVSITKKRGTKSKQHLACGKMWMWFLLSFYTSFILCYFFSNAIKRGLIWNRKAIFKRLYFKIILVWHKLPVTNCFKLRQESGTLSFAPFERNSDQFECDLIDIAISEDVCGSADTRNNVGSFLTVSLCFSYQIKKNLTSSSAQWFLFCKMHLWLLNLLKAIYAACFFSTCRRSFNG